MLELCRTVLCTRKKQRTSLWGMSRNPLTVSSRRVATRRQKRSLCQTEACTWCTGKWNVGCWWKANKVQVTQCHAGFIPTEVVTQAASSDMPIHAMSSGHDQAGHRGQDATLARFRMRYWAPHGSIARSVKMSCQLCKLCDVNFLEQQMGLLLVARLHLTMPCLIYLAP